MKYALITGATSGIGLAMARVLARKNYGIIMASSSKNRLSKAKKSMNERFPHVKIYDIVEDLSLEGSGARLYKKAMDIGVDINILINNAGYGLVGPTEKIDMEKDVKMLYLNMISPTVLCKLFLKDMYKKRNGKILNVASVGSFQPGPYNSTYFASKAYLYSYSMAIRYEAKKYGVTVSTLCPGTTKTKFFNKEGLKTPTWAMSPTKVAEYAVEGLENGADVIIPGKIDKALKAVPEKLKILAIAKTREILGRSSLN